MIAGNWTLKSQYADEMDVSDTEELAPEEQDFSEAVAELMENAEADNNIEDEMEKERKALEEARRMGTAVVTGGGVVKHEEVEVEPEPATSEAGEEADDGDDDDDDDDDEQMYEVY